MISNITGNKSRIGYAATAIAANINDKMIDMMFSASALNDRRKKPFNR